MKQMILFLRVALLLGRYLGSVAYAQLQICRPPWSFIILFSNGVMRHYWAAPHIDQTDRALDAGNWTAKVDGESKSPTTRQLHLKRERELFGASQSLTLEDSEGIYMADGISRWVNSHLLSRVLPTLPVRANSFSLSRDQSCSWLGFSNV